MSDSQRSEFWLAGVVLDLRFALGLLSGIFFPFFLFRLSLPLLCFWLGNTSKCYPPLFGNIPKLSSLDTPLLPLLFILCTSVYKF